MHRKKGGAEIVPPPPLPQKNRFQIHEVSSGERFKIWYGVFLAGENTKSSGNRIYGTTGWKNSVAG